ncbi:hypothetical protein [Rhizobium sp. Root651]|uniref:hypothetical protein n=1 Tax=Rhizobium sp. Root651 TaxID=1736577 RepID=UPI000712D33C|nr:hypothetical protein [Rhizobium sp. Root651]KRA65316.1 hypothetical protein ASD85_25525 [Rhizobium sp. Root651]
MAERTREHIIGDRGELRNMLTFAESGYASNKLEKDYGEDFFVVTHAAGGGTVEPFRIFVQSKATDPATGVAARWTEYVDPLTVRNWLLGNEMVVVIKRDLRTNSARYCIPEEVYRYEDVHECLFAGETRKEFPITCDTNFTEETPDKLVWRARVRHYDRIIRLALPDDEFRGRPAAEIYAMELALRLGLLDAHDQISIASLEHLNRLSNLEGDVKIPELTEDEKHDFIACFHVADASITQRVPGLRTAQYSLELVAGVLFRVYRDWKDLQN